MLSQSRRQYWRAQRRLYNLLRAEALSEREEKVDGKERYLRDFAVKLIELEYRRKLCLSDTDQKSST